LTLTTSWRAVRRRILTPGIAETSIEKRGFHAKSPAAKERLETVGKTFLVGYGEAMEARTPADAVAALEQVPDWLRGFAYEGAGMGFAVLDGLPFGRSDHVRRFLADPIAAEYQYLVYVGIGWAMARLPRFRWPKPESLDPALVPLVLDGYGFHQAYFHTDRYARGRYRDPGFPWPGGEHGWYANNAIDQGIGRAAWFICGTDPDRVADLIGTFAPERRGDLYAGAGLAAVYAGGVEEEELQNLRHRAGDHAGDLAQGAAFAADARVRAGIVPAHSALATEVLCGATPEEAARLTRDSRPAATAGGPLPAYEVWRRQTAAQLVSLGGINT
jgi:hypothetical protein